MNLPWRVSWERARVGPGCGPAWCGNERRQREDLFRGPKVPDRHDEHSPPLAPRSVQDGPHRAGHARRAGGPLPLSQAAGPAGRAGSVGPRGGGRRGRERPGPTRPDGRTLCGRAITARHFASPPSRVLLVF